MFGDGKKIPNFFPHGLLHITPICGIRWYVVTQSYYSE